ncbi:MAG: hypothetical protein WC010_01150 [Candidatus Absconditabacterales bacterium]
METSNSNKPEKDGESRIIKLIKEYPVEITLIILMFGLILFFGTFILIGMNTPPH